MMNKVFKKGNWVLFSHGNIYATYGGKLLYVGVATSASRIKVTLNKSFRDETWVEVLSRKPEITFGVYNTESEAMEAMSLIQGDWDASNDVMKAEQDRLRQMIKDHNKAARATSNPNKGGVI